MININKNFESEDEEQMTVSRHRNKSFMNPRED